MGFGRQPVLRDPSVPPIPLTALIGAAFLLSDGPAPRVFPEGVASTLVGPFHLPPFHLAPLDPAALIRPILLCPDPRPHRGIRPVRCTILTWGRRVFLRPSRRARQRAGQDQSEKACPKNGGVRRASHVILLRRLRIVSQGSVSVPSAPLSLRVLRLGPSVPDHRPLDPNPPVPRAEPGPSSPSSTVRTGRAMRVKTSWAIRSPGSIRTGVAASRFQAETSSGPS